MMFDLLDWLILAIDLFFPVLSLAGAALCIVYRRLSPWLILTMVGFLGQGVSQFVSGIGFRLMNHLNIGSTTAYQMLGLVLSLSLMLMIVLVLVGLGLTLADVANQLARLRERPPEPRARFVAPETRADWIPEEPGSQNITK